MTVADLSDRATTGHLLRIGVTAAPEDGKANAAVITLLSRALDLPKSRCDRVPGATARDKVVRILA